MDARLAAAFDDQRVALPGWMLLLIVAGPFAVLFAVVAYDHLTERLRRRR